MPQLRRRTSDRSAEALSRAPNRMYPIIIFGVLRVKCRDTNSRMVKNKAVYQGHVQYP